MRVSVLRPCYINMRGLNVEFGSGNALLPTAALDEIAFISRDGQVRVLNINL